MLLDHILKEKPRTDFARRNDTLINQGEGKNPVPEEGLKGSVEAICFASDPSTHIPPPLLSLPFPRRRAKGGERGRKGESVENHHHFLSSAGEKEGDEIGGKRSRFAHLQQRKKGGAFPCLGVMFPFRLPNPLVNSVLETSGEREKQDSPPLHSPLSVRRNVVSLQLLPTDTFLRTDFSSLPLSHPLSQFTLSPPPPSTPLHLSGKREEEERKLLSPKKREGVGGGLMG